MAVPGFSVLYQWSRCPECGQFLPGGSFGAANEKASLEGMSEAFGSSAGADDQREAAREEERPQSLECGYAGRPRVRQTRSRKASHAENGGEVERRSQPVGGGCLVFRSVQAIQRRLARPTDASLCSGQAILKEADLANRGGKKRGSIRRWSLMKVVAAGRGRRKRPSAIWILPREEVRVRSGVGRHGTAGGGCGAASQRHALYAVGQGFQQ